MADHDNKANNKDMGSEGIPTARHDDAVVGSGGQVGTCRRREYCRLEVAGTVLLDFLRR